MPGTTNEPPRWKLPTEATSRRGFGPTPTRAGPANAAGYSANESAQERAQDAAAPAALAHAPKHGGKRFGQRSEDRDSDNEPGEVLTERAQDGPEALSLENSVLKRRVERTGEGLCKPAVFSGSFGHLLLKLGLYSLRFLGCLDLASERVEDLPVPESPPAPMHYRGR